MVKFAIFMYLVSFSCAVYVFWPQIVKHEQFHKIISQVLSPEIQTKIMSFRKAPGLSHFEQIYKLDDSHPQNQQSLPEQLKSEEEKRLLEQFKEADRIE